MTGTKRAPLTAEEVKTIADYLLRLPKEQDEAGNVSIRLEGLKANAAGKRVQENIGLLLGFNSQVGGHFVDGGNVLTLENKSYHSNPTKFLTEVQDFLRDMHARPNLLAESVNRVEASLYEQKKETDILRSYQEKNGGSLFGSAGQGLRQLKPAQGRE